MKDLNASQIKSSR